MRPRGSSRSIFMFTKTPSNCPHRVTFTKGIPQKTQSRSLRCSYARSLQALPDPRSEHRLCSPCLSVRIDTHPRRRTANYLLPPWVTRCAAECLISSLGASPSKAAAGRQSGEAARLRAGGSKCHPALRVRYFRSPGCAHADRTFTLFTGSRRHQQAAHGREGGDGGGQGGQGG